MGKWLVVGAGLSGGTFARKLAEAGNSVQVVEKSTHVAGNCYDPVVDGNRIHVFGPHLFHTNSEKVVEFLSRFTTWEKYEHKVLAEIDGYHIPLPFNFTSIEMLFDKDQAQIYKDALSKELGKSQEITILRLRESKNEDLRTLGNFIYEKVFLGYTTKQWGLKPTEISPAVTARVPVRANYDDRYFTDQFQAMPSLGFEQLVTNMLDHPNIKTTLGHEVTLAEIEALDAETKVAYTGALDSLYGWDLGALPYRSLTFEHLNLMASGPHLKTGTLNFPNSKEYTRITDFSHFLTPQTRGASLVREYPCAYIPGENDAYYPIPTDETKQLHEEYLKLMATTNSNLVALGRLGDYKYYNMDQAVARALKLAADFIEVE